MSPPKTARAAPACAESDPRLVERLPDQLYQQDIPLAARTQSTSRRFAQRPALLALAKAIETRHAALRRDECGDWRINGRRGHIYAVPGSLDPPDAAGFLLHSAASSARAWTNTKRDLAFAELTQDGDDEGVFLLDRLPSAAEAQLIRKRLGVAKARSMGEEELARRRKWASDNLGVRPEFSPASSAPAPFTPDSVEGENSNAAALHADNNPVDGKAARGDGAFALVGAVVIMADATITDAIVADTTTIADPLASKIAAAIEGEAQ
jgi:hypothetical protein